MREKIREVKQHVIKTKKEKINWREYRETEKNDIFNCRLCFIRSWLCRYCVADTADCTVLSDDSVLFFTKLSEAARLVREYKNI